MALPSPGRGGRMAKPGGSACGISREFCRAPPRASRCQITVTIAILIAVCLVLLILAFLLPRFSWYPQRGVDRTLEAGPPGSRQGAGAPGRAAREAVQLRRAGGRQERRRRTQGPREGRVLAGARGPG